MTTPDHQYHCTANNRARTCGIAAFALHAVSHAEGGVLHVSGRGQTHRLAGSFGAY